MKQLCLRTLLAALAISAPSLFGSFSVWRTLTSDPGTDQVFPVELPVGSPPVADFPITIIANPTSVVITPDATKTVICSGVEPSGRVQNASANIFLMDLTTAPISLITSTTVGSGPLGLAISPDGAKVYCIPQGGGDITILWVSDLSLFATIPQTLFGSYIPRSISLSPTMPEGYVSTNDNRIFVIDTDTASVKSLGYNTPFTSASSSITPDGEELYTNSAALSYITLSDGFLHDITGMPTALATYGIAVSPDGTALYAVQLFGSLQMLTVVDLTSHSYVTQYPIPFEEISPALIFLTPDGKTAILPDTEWQQDAGHILEFIDLTTGNPSYLDLTSSPYSTLLYSPVTPDQAPTALFNTSVKGLTVSFDGSDSSSPVGTIAAYAWNFGDGQSITTTAPTVSHTYLTSGIYTITLTVTNTAGTSTNVTFTGQMVSNNGGPSAVLQRQISVQAHGVSHFRGKVHRKHHKTLLNTWWFKSHMTHVRKYQIYSGNQRVASVSAHHKHQKTLRLHPQHSDRVFSEKYRHYLDRKYSIRVLDTFGHTSRPTDIHVEKG